MTENLSKPGQTTPPKKFPRIKDVTQLRDIPNQGAPKRDIFKPDIPEKDVDKPDKPGIPDPNTNVETGRSPDMWDYIFGVNVVTTGLGRFLTGFAPVGSTLSAVGIIAVAGFGFVLIVPALGQIQRNKEDETRGKIDGATGRTRLENQRQSYYRGYDLIGRPAFEYKQRYGKRLD